MMKVTRWNSRVPSRIAYHKRPFWPVPCHKRIGIPCYILFTITVTCLLQIFLLSNYLLSTISVLAHITLLKTTCHFLLLLVVFDTLTYRKDYDWSPILVGQQTSCSWLSATGSSHCKIGCIRSGSTTACDASWAMRGGYYKCKPLKEMLSLLFKGKFATSLMSHVIPEFFASCPCHRKHSSLFFPI